MAVLLAYPLAMTFTLVYTGEHYVIDVLVGWLYVALTFLVVGWAERWWARRRAVIAPVNQQPEPIRVGVLGARGRMGLEVCKAVDAAGDLELVAAVDQGDPRSGVADARAQVIVDFTTPDAVMDNLRWAVDQGIHVVVGTTGFSDQRLDQVRGWLAGRPGRRADRAQLRHRRGADDAVRGAAARYFESAEIVEQHHPRKLDAPSGTAAHTARLIAAARAEAGLGPMPDATKEEAPGARGTEVDGVRVHSVRAAGLVAHQEVLFGGPGETLTIRHDSLTGRRSCRASCRRPHVADRPGLTVGLDALLD